VGGYANLPETQGTLLARAVNRRVFYRAHVFVVLDTRVEVPEAKPGRSEWVFPLDQELQAQVRDSPSYKGAVNFRLGTGEWFLYSADLPDLGDPKQARNRIQEFIDEALGRRIKK
jgi:hypothetical protein